jgi:hypothetical protein
MDGMTNPAHVAFSNFVGFPVDKLGIERYNLPILHPSKGERTMKVRTCTMMNMCEMCMRSMRMCRSANFYMLSADNLVLLRNFVCKWEA